MKNKLLLASCVICLVVSAAAALSALSARAHAASAPPASGFVIVAEDSDTRVYTFERDGHQCFLASTKGGSGVSLQCPH